MIYAKVCAGIVAANIMATPEYVANKNDCAYRKVDNPVALGHILKTDGTFAPPPKKVISVEEAKAAKVKEIRDEARAAALARFPAAVREDVALGLNDALPAEDPNRSANVRAAMQKISVSAEAAVQAVGSMDSAAEVEAVNASVEVTKDL